MSRESSQAIYEAAAAWQARIDRAPLTPEEKCDLDAWLAADSRRQGAFAMASVVMDLADCLKTSSPTNDVPALDMFPRPWHADIAHGSTRRWWLAAGGATAAAAACGVAAIAYQTWRPAEKYESVRGEVRRLPLADGTVLTLNTATKVTVSYSNARRDIQLVTGEALFEVAKNPIRPFYVDAGDVQVRAVGTKFFVRKLSGAPTLVLVSEGIVEVTRKDGPDATPVRIFANQQALAPSNAPIIPSSIAPNAVARKLLWRQGMLSFSRTTLREASDEFSRYGGPRIEIEDPTVSSRTITGLFAANNPEGFADAVALSLNLSTRRDGDTIYLSR